MRDDCFNPYSDRLSLHIVRMIYVNIPIRLCHVDVFIQDAVQESRLHIHLVQRKSVLGGQTQHDANRRELSHQRKGLFVIVPILLQEPLSD